MIRLSFSRPDGGVSFFDNPQGIDSDALEARLRRKTPNAAGGFYQAVSDDWIRGADVGDLEIPTDRTFRNAWEYNDGVKVNVLKAKDITKNRLRAERKPLLEAQDILFQRALEIGASTAEIVKEKQRLRDITKQVDSLTSLDKLKALSV